MKTIAKFEKVSLSTWNDAYSMTKTIPNTFSEAYKDITLPHRKTVGSAGYDFIIPFDLSIPPHTIAFIPTGIKCEMKKGYVLELYPRSSLGSKYGVRLCNTVGIIDSDYYNNVANEGHILAFLEVTGDKYLTLKKGDAFMQGIFKKFYLAEEEEVTHKRVGGFGSTSKSF